MNLSGKVYFYQTPIGGGRMVEHTVTFQPDGTGRVVIKDRDMDATLFPKTMWEHLRDNRLMTVRHQDNTQIVYAFQTTYADVDLAEAILMAAFDSEGLNDKD